MGSARKHTDRRQKNPTGSKRATPAAPPPPPPPPDSAAGFAVSPICKTISGIRCGALTLQGLVSQRI